VTYLQTLCLHTLEFMVTRFGQNPKKWNLGLANKSFFQRACYLCLGSVPICPKRLISGGKLGRVSGIKALPSQRPGVWGSHIPSGICRIIRQKPRPGIKILTKTLHLHSIEPSSLRNSLKWPLRNSLNRPPSGLRDLLSPSIPQSSVSTFDHSPVPYTLHTYILEWSCF